MTEMQDSTTVRTGPATTGAAIQAEAARYAVLRRLGPALKHDMVVNLQAVTMMSEVLGAKLERGVPPQHELQNSMARIHRLARDAVANCLRVVGWLEPSDDETISLREGVEECLALVRSNFNFRGFVLRTELPANAFEVSRVLLRHLLLGSLLHLTDQVRSGGEVSVRGEIASGMVRLNLQLTPGRIDEEALPFEPPYRQVEWTDLQALAAADDAQLRRESDRIMLSLPRMVATGPVGIVPL
jgi:hypothetical protein